MNNKGDVFQILIVLILVTIIAIVGIITLTLSWNINKFWDNHPEIMPVNSIAAQSNQIIENTAPRTTDYTIFFAFLFLNIGVVISAVRTNFSPTLIFLFIMLSIFSILVAAGIVNIYQGVAHADIVSDVGSQLTLTNFVLSKYTPLIICIISALVITIMYGKSGGDIVA